MSSNEQFRLNFSRFVSKSVRWELTFLAECICTHPTAATTYMYKVPFPLDALNTASFASMVKCKVHHVMPYQKSRQLRYARQIAHLSVHSIYQLIFLLLLFLQKIQLSLWMGLSLYLVNLILISLIHLQQPIKVWHLDSLPG